jgi:hypothetical protein
MELAVAAHCKPVTVSVPEQVPDPVDVTSRVPSAFRSYVVSVVTPPAVDASAQLPTSGLELPPPHPIPTAARAASAKLRTFTIGDLLT